MIDSHCHLAGEEFEPDLDAVVARARAAGVSSALVILSADDEGEARRAERVRDTWAHVRFSIGIHPHQAGKDAGDIDARVAGVERAAAAHGAVAIGEIGLDYHYDFSPRAVQQDVFRHQIALAQRLGRPVIVHTREAADDTFGILREAGGALRGVFHCFTGDAAMANAALEIGFHLSFAGIVTFPKAAELREVARVVPADRLLIETDAPYLAPVPHRGKRNEPALVARVLETLAEVRKADKDELAARTSANFETLFSA